MPDTIAAGSSVPPKEIEDVPALIDLTFYWWGGELGETENKLMNKQMLLKAMKQVVEGEGAEWWEGDLKKNLLQGPYLEWSRKTHLISDIRVESAG